MPQLSQILKENSKKLVDTSTRNRLIHVNRQANPNRGNFINFSDERSDDIFASLKTQSQKMRFFGTVPEKQQSQENANPAIPETTDEQILTDKTSIKINLTQEVLEKKLFSIAKNTRTAQEEQGINILYIAMGFLTWYETPDSKDPRESPLILLPVQLIRDKQYSTYEIECLGDDVETNLPLKEKMRAEFNIEIPEIDDSVDWNPADYFQKVKDAISTKETWIIDEDGMQLGFFTFAKMLMLKDLEVDNWDNLDENTLIKRLLIEGFEYLEPLFKEDDNLDDKLPVEQLCHVIDADTSQTKVIEEVNSGRNLVVQGPPGTGKSQTITNILATAAHRGKKVLFVAEKMAALKVVHDRLVKVGLDDLCLELHSKSANKKAFLNALKLTLSREPDNQNSTNVDEKLTEVRDELNEISKSLNNNIPDRDYNFRAVMSKLYDAHKNRNNRTLNINLPSEQLSKREIENLTQKITDYQNATEEYGAYKFHPLHGVKNLNIQPFELNAVSDEISQFELKYQDWLKYKNTIQNIFELEELDNKDEVTALFSIIAYLKISPPLQRDEFVTAFANKDDKRFGECLKITKDWQDALKPLEKNLVETLWNLDLLQIRESTIKATQSIFSRFLGDYRKHSKLLQSNLKNPLPKSPDERLRLVDELIEAQKKRQLFNEEKAYLELKLTSLWRNERTDVTTIIGLLEWIARAPSKFFEFTADDIIAIKDNNLQQIENKNYHQCLNELNETLSTVISRLDIEDQENIHQQAEKLKQIREHFGLYSDWTKFCSVRSGIINSVQQDIIKSGLECFLLKLDNEEISIDELLHQILYSIYKDKWIKCRKSNPALQNSHNYQDTNRHELVENFKQLEEEKIRGSQDKIIHDHLNALPRGAAGGMRLIRDQIAKQRNHKSIRYMMRNAGETIQQIKPIFLMSPISVAQFLPPRSIEFDLLVIDEASQVKPAEALGSIIRAKQIVVVGDQKQLPPTSFFDRLVDDIDSENEEEDEPSTIATDAENILSMCEARGIAQRMLKWHYRSKDPSLIAISNREFYDNKLVLFPNTELQNGICGLSLTRVAGGVYTSRASNTGRAGTNQIEAERIVDKVIELANDEQLSQYSVGIVAFSKSQSDMISEKLELRRRQNETLDNFLEENKNENVFVKNIENVQGDERDIILISVGYGPTAAGGELPMRFGPINTDGGERRLNVLFSRSRIACEVFCSFNPADIRETQNQGPQILKKFLRFAENGLIEENLQTGSEPDSEFETDVAQEIQNLGFHVDYQVGTAGFRIDLGVKSQDGENYILAVECDGATYHSALWARERDRLRQSILESFGWRFHRIWSTDWFYRRNQEVERLRKILEESTELEIGQHLKGANSDM